MEELKNIWEKVNDLQVHIQQMMPVESIESIALQIEQQEAARRKTIRLTARLLVATIIVLAILITGTNVLIGKSITLLQIIGLVSISIGMFNFIYFFYQNTLKSSFNASTQTFVYQTVRLYKTRKRLIIIQPIIYTIFLGGGIAMILVEYLSVIDGYWGILGAMIGLLFALTGAIATLEMKKYEKNEGEILKQLVSFQES
ncbi:MAG: hypothetical protein AAGI23_06305 [Bacteroidota bacterium]